ncbi:hypothetical protein DMC47_34190 [Nostoc sp. 3335mG]|nr:hypothetical protein DMC47_34190 [Nostoc sp. 3335mG]
MADPRRRFVDSHVHLWDEHGNPWYRFPRPGEAGFGEGLKEPFPTLYLWNDYLASVTGLDLAKWVHVTAVTRAQDVEAETIWVDAIARTTGLPYALIGTVETDVPFADMEATLDREMRHPAYRGIRLLGGADHGAPDIARLFACLSERKLVYDAVANPGTIAATAKGLARYPDLVVVMEHTGWPLRFDRTGFDQWHDEMAELAALPNAHCKLSGLGMGFHRTDLDVFRRYFDACIALFGADRCMFGSNFPVDLSYGAPGELFAVFEAVAAGLPPDDAERIFAGTAERVYRI